MIVVGIHNSFFKDTNSYSSDGNIAIMIDGEIKLAIATERVTRKKYDGSFESALTFALNRLSLLKNDVDAISLVGFAMPIKDEEDHALVKEPIYKYFGRRIDIHYIASHHEAHAWGAIAQSGFDKALVVILDHSGSIIEYSSNKNLATARVEQTSYYLWNNNKLELVLRDHDDFADLGYGRFYSKVTRYVGFSSYQHAGKLMGLSPIGKNIDIPAKLMAYKTINGKEVTSLTLSKHSDDGLKDLTNWFKLNFGIALLGPFDGIDFQYEQIYLSKWAQMSLERSVTSKVKSLVDKYNIDKICIAGGVGLNSVMNRFIKSETGCEVFIPSSPGDAGLSFGALAYYKHKMNIDQVYFNRNPYLGTEYSEEEILNELKNISDIIYYKAEDVVLDAAQKLHNGNIIAWFQGASEFSPRALGNRSIIASPKNPWIKDIINHRIKKREWFRPFGASVPEEHITDLFYTTDTSYPYMMQTVNVKPSIANEIPSVIHYDNSSRIHSVCKKQNPKFHRLIIEFSKLGHLPVVLNTSFNLSDMPLVESPKDALECFISADGIDVLVIKDFVVTKKNFYDK